MKALLISALLLASQVVFATPVALEGDYKRTGGVQAMSRVIQHVAFKASEAEAYKEQGFTCKKVETKYLCTKLDPIAVLPGPVATILSDMAPHKITFGASTDDYYLITETDLLNEWVKGQNVRADRIRFEEVYWRHIIQGPKKIILNNGEVTLEFLWMEDHVLGSVQKHTYTDPLTKETAQYWGIVLYSNQ